MATPVKGAASKPAGDKPKRKMLTPNERLAKAQAEVERLEAAAVKKNESKAAQLFARRNLLQGKVAKLTEEIDKINSELTELQVSEASNQPTLDEGTES